jgi:hypothetical protein
MIKKNITAQIWVETATYTLIGLVIIGILLAAAMPQIDKIKDRGVLTDTKEAMDLLDVDIRDIEQAPGNIRIFNLRMSKGKLEIDSENNSIRYILENTRLEFSEPGEVIKEGNFFIRTDTQGSRFAITMLLDYNNSINITYDNQILKTLQPGTGGHKIKIENVGDNAFDEKTHLKFDIL